MTVTFFPHQQRGIEIARTNPKFAFGLKPGLGKTILSIGICAERPMRTVVLCPKSILRSAWEQDASKFDNIKTCVVHGETPARRTAAIMRADWDIAITTYETWRRHAADYLAVGTKRMILDESSKARNPDAKLTKALIPFADQMEEVYLLSGTMAPNHVVEYHQQLRMLGGPKSRTYWKFAHHYAYPVTGRRWGRGPDGKPKLVEYIKTWEQTPEQKAELETVLQRWCWFLRKEDCLQLPPQDDLIRYVELSDEEEETYRRVQEELAIAHDAGEDAVKQQAVLMKIRQVTGGAVKTSAGMHVLGTSKIDALSELLDEIGSEPVVIWAEFTSEIDRIVKMIEGREESVATIDGRTSDKAGDTAALFQMGDLKRLVCHPAAAGHGITLTAAAYSIYFSMSFSAEQYEQSRNRIHRIGQTRPCTYYHLCATTMPDRSDKEAMARGYANTVDMACFRVSCGKMKASAAIEMEVERVRRAKAVR